MMGRMSSGSCFISFRWKSELDSRLLSLASLIGPWVPLEFSESLMPSLESSGEPLVVPLSRQAFLLGGKPSLNPLTGSLPRGELALSSFRLTVSCSCRNKHTAAQLITCGISETSEIKNSFYSIRTFFSYRLDLWIQANSNKVKKRLARTDNQSEQTSESLQP